MSTIPASGSRQDLPDSHPRVDRSRLTGTGPSSPRPGGSGPEGRKTDLRGVPPGSKSPSTRETAGETAGGTVDVPRCRETGVYELSSLHVFPEGPHWSQGEFVGEICVLFEVAYPLGMSGTWHLPRLQGQVLKMSLMLCWMR